jgi:hypothetical protein
VAGTNGTIFLTTVDVTGGIGLDQNWVKVLDEKEMLFVMKMVMFLERIL